MQFTVAELLEVMQYFLSIDQKLSAIQNSLTTERKDLSGMAVTLADLQAKVTAQNTVVNSAITLIQGLKAQLDAAIAANDPAQLQAISDALGTQDTALANAVASNTPGAPATPPAGTPPAGGGSVPPQG